MPRDVTTFIHRAGRTARRGEAGLLSCLVTPYEKSLYAQLLEGEGSHGELTPLQLSGGRSGERRAAAAAAPTSASGDEEPLIWDAAPWELEEEEARKEEERVGTERVVDSA